MNKAYYITFGCNGMLFDGGWVKIWANSDEEARDIFVKHYRAKARKDGFLNFAFSYDEERFVATGMNEKGNYGKFCHEEIGKAE